MNRRRFTFWLGFGLFSLGERLGVGLLDNVAAAAMRMAEGAAEPEAPATSPVHWRAVDNKTWRWFERETYADGRWTVTGITTPVNKWSGQLYAERSGYLDIDEVPDSIRFGQPTGVDDTDAAVTDPTARQPDPSRRARHGRPPSKWLRSLRTDEIRIWLKTIEVPPAGVSGMTFWTHLTRDHSFDPDRIVGLTIDEQAKLHAAAHYGY